MSMILSEFMNIRIVDHPGIQENWPVGMHSSLLRCSSFFDILRSVPNRKIPKRAVIFKDHRVAQLWGVKDYTYLVDEGRLLDKLLEVAKKLELNVVNSFVHKFEPQGVSVVLILAESHLAVHTWPEHYYLHLDLFTCSPKTNVKVLKAILRQESPCERISVGKIQYD
jgi:S-adenosylmethionine decarboxylase proenzyme